MDEATIEMQIEEHRAKIRSLQKKHGYELSFQNNVDKIKKAGKHPDILKIFGAMKGNLSARRCEVLFYMAQGLSNAQIGEMLFIEEKSVKFHVTGINHALDCKQRLQSVLKILTMTGNLQPMGKVRIPDAIPVMPDVNQLPSQIVDQAL